jgi:hypothetical protein
LVLYLKYKLIEEATIGIADINIVYKVLGLKKILGKMKKALKQKL